MASVESNESNGQDPEILVDLEKEDVDMEMEPKVEDIKEEDGQTAVKRKKRYILFVGNLPYSAKEEDIRRHFQKLENYIVNVDVQSYKNGRARGYCYIEFKNKDGYEKAMKMNMSKLDGRPIKVEYKVPATFNVRQKRHVKNAIREHYAQKVKVKQSKWKIKKITSKLKKVKK